MSFTNDEWFVVKDIEGFVNAARTMVFANYGPKDSSKDFIDHIADSEKEEFDKILPYGESLTIIQELLKKQTNKKTKDKRFIVNDEIYINILTALSDRMTSNLLNSLVNKGLIETAYDEEKNDFVFWAKENPETD